MNRKQKLEILHRIAAGEPLTSLNTGNEIAFKVQETGLFYQEGKEMNPQQVSRFTSNRNNKIITLDMEDLNA